MNTRFQGGLAEAEACRYIEALGMLPLCKNYRKATGEIDLICMDKDAIVFIEVKARVSSKRGLPQEAVTPSKQRKIVKTALMYLKENRLHSVKMRFDVIAVLGSEIKYIPSAFNAGMFRLNK